MENPKISRKSVHKLWTKVLLPELRQKLSGGREALRQASQDVGAMADKAKSLIEYHVAPLARKFHESVKNFQTNDTLEISYLRYQKRWEAMAVPLQDTQLLQSGYMYLGCWKLDQMQRIAKGLSVEDPIGFEILQTASDAMAMFEVRRSEPLIAQKADRIVSFSNSLPLIGGILDKTPVPVWIVDLGSVDTDKFLFDHLRTAVLENWDVRGNQGQTVLGTLEQVPANAINTADIQKVWLLSATVSGKLIPLPTPLDEYGLPRINYSLTLGGGHVVWSPKAGQFFLVLDTEAPKGEFNFASVAAYTTKSINNLHLTPHTDSPTSVTTATRLEDLSEYTRQVFLVAEHFGDRSLYGSYALGEYEQLQYAAEMLKKSWDYEWTPKNMNEFLAAGKPILKNLHQKGAIETANCSLANAEFAEAARVFGYNVRLVTGFLGSNENSIDAPGHMWTEAYIDGHWKELDVTPVGTQPVNKRLPGTLSSTVDMLFQFLNHQPWGAVLARLVNPHFQSTSDSLMALANDMKKIPGEMAFPLDHHTTVVGDHYVFDMNWISSQEMQVKVFESRPDRLATKGACLGDFAILTDSEFLVESDVAVTLHHFKNCAGLEASLNYYTGGVSYSVRSGSFIEPVPSTDSDPQHFKATGELGWALESWKSRELKGDLLGDKDNQMVISAYSEKIFGVCSDLKCVRREFKLPPKTPDAVVVDLLTSLRFLTVRADDQNGQNSLYAFSPKADLVLKFDEFNDEDVGDSHLRFGPMNERLLAIPKEISSDAGRYENMATKFAALLFAREKGGLVPSEDRHLLKEALYLLLRHPPVLRRLPDIVLAAYVMDEARRHQLSEVSFVSVVGLPSSQVKQCDIMEGCELKFGSKGTLDSKPLSSINAILLEIAKGIEGASGRRKAKGVDFSDLPIEYHTWFKGFLARNFQKVP